LTFHWIGKSLDGNTITLNRLNDKMFIFPDYFTSEWALANTDVIRTGAVIDVETTGLDQRKDTIIEIGIRIFRFNRLTGEIISLDTSYSSFQDPGVPISKEVQRITGITDEMLTGKTINWNEVNTLLSTCHIIIAHNAAFDRPFVDNQSTESANKIWACSFKQIDWVAYGFPSQKLDVLSIYHGYFTDAHRALNDSDALIYLLSLTNINNQSPYLLELLNNAKKPTILISALNAPYEKKDFLKARSYRWEAQNKVWSKEVYKDTYEEEIKWLEDTIYDGKFRGKSLEIQAINHFKVTM
jgi:DNA polymerase-3 subunit epsilon